MPEFLDDPHIWLLFSFIIFAVLMWRMGKSTITGMLDKRINEIQAEIETAETLRVEAQELLAQYQRKHRDALADSEEIIMNAKKYAHDLRTQAEQELAEQMARKEAQLRDRLQRAEQNAIAEIQDHAADLAIKATTEVITNMLDKKTTEKLADESIKNIAKNLH